MTFESREDAGRRLGCQLRDMPVDADLVLGLPRGGVVVAAEAARILQRPLDVLVVRKIGHPFHREFAVGAMAENGIVLLNNESIGSNTTVRLALDDVIRDEELRLQDYERKFHFGIRYEVAGLAVLVIDDGLATGSTTEAGVLAARKKGARRVIVAVPVASTCAVARLKRSADDVVSLFTDPDFDAVGRYYESFPQTTDEEVLALLHAQ